MQYTNCHTYTNVYTSNLMVLVLLRNHAFAAACPEREISTHPVTTYKNPNTPQNRLKRPVVASGIFWYNGPYSAAATILAYLQNTPGSIKKNRNR